MERLAFVKKALASTVGKSNNHLEYLTVGKSNNHLEYLNICS